MNQLTVVDVIENTHHSIRLAPFEELQWEVIWHGDNDVTQKIDSYETLAEAQSDYPEAFCSWKETEFEDCIGESS